MPDLIVIDVTEYEKIRLNSKSEVVDIKGDGKIVIKNPSKQSKLWNLNCDLKETVNTSIETRDLDVGTLNPGKIFIKEYEIQNLKKPSLKVTEEFKTNVNNDKLANKVFLLNSVNRCSLKIILINPTKASISSIKLHRNFPDYFQEIEVVKPTVGAASILEEIGSKFLVWDIHSLGPEQKTELLVHCNVNPQNTDEKPLGEFNVTYSINNYKRSLISPEVRGLTNSMSGINRNEGTEKGSWNCTIEFINESEFQVQLEEVKVSHKGPSGIEIIVSQTPGKLLNPEQSWDFDFQIESIRIPELISKIEFTPLYVLITRVIGEINKDSTIYDVIS